MFDTITARACPIFSHLKADVTPNVGVYKDEITVQCKLGFIFPDTSNNKKLRCNQEGEWEPTLGACTRKL